MVQRTAILTVVAALLLAAGAPGRGGDAPLPTGGPTRPKPAIAAPPAAGGLQINAPDPNRSLPQINRRIALDSAALIKAGKLAEASGLLDESEINLREFAKTSRIELWDSTIAPIMRLLDLRRGAVERAQANAGPVAVGGNGTPSASTKATPQPAVRLTPDQNRALAAIRADLNATGISIRQNKLDDAQRTLASAQSKLQSLVDSSHLPIWSVPIASAFQLADKNRSELKARNAELEMALEKAEEAKKAAKAARPASQPVDEQHPRSGLPPGAPAPGFAAVTLDGTPFTTQQLEGKWVLLDFWATWCGPCRAEIPHIREAFDTFGRDKRLVILSLSEDTQISAPADFVTKNQIPWAQGFIGEGSPVSQNYHVTGIPTILLIDPQGKVAANNLRGEAIKQKLAQVLGAPPEQKPTQ